MNVLLSTLKLCHLTTSATAQMLLISSKNQTLSRFMLPAVLSYSLCTLISLDDSFILVFFCNVIINFLLPLQISLC